MLDLVFRARRVITAFGEVDRCVGVQDGLIVAIEPYDSRSPRTPASWSTYRAAGHLESGTHGELYANFRETGDFGTAWGGSASLQVGLPAVCSGARVRGHSLAQVVEWMAERPTRLAGLAHKGSIALGGDAGFCLLAPTRRSSSTCTGSAHRNPVSPYDGRALSGMVRRTWLRGARIDVSGPPAGRLLRRGAR
jgi:hypothetical protein